MRLRVAQIVADTLAEGPGRRFAVWVQGCPIRCEGCCNPQMFGESGGEEIEVEALAERVLATPGIEGISFLGGEPMEQAEAVLALATRVKAAGLTVMVFSGWTIAELRARKSASIDGLIAIADLLVDGRYEASLPEARRRWIGSSNQVMHFLTDRYSPADPQFTAGNTVEIRLVDGEIRVNGWPALAEKLVPRKRLKLV